MLAAGRATAAGRPCGSWEVPTSPAGAHAAGLQTALTPGRFQQAQEPADGAMARSGDRAAGRKPAQRRELFRSEDLSLQWREIRKAVSAAAQPHGRQSALQALPLHAKACAACRLSIGGWQGGRRRSTKLQPAPPLRCRPPLVMLPSGPCRPPPTPCFPCRCRARACRTWATRAS